MNELTKKERGIYEDPKGIDPLLWEELNKLDRNEVASRASVQYNTNNTCFLIPFLDRIYGCNPTQQFIRDTSETAEELSFQLYLVLLNYLIRVKPLGISGRMVTGQELKGGDFFFKGPHVLFTRPLEKRFDRDPDAFTEAGLRLGGAKMEFGDASFRLWPFRISLDFFIGYRYFNSVRNHL